MSLDRGCCYLFAYNLGYAERIAVSLYTLRQHWNGPVLLLLDNVTEDIGRRIADDPAIHATVKVIDPVEGHRHSCYITKTLVPDWSPFERTLLIDGDTTIVGSFDELFGAELAITHFSNWHSLGSMVSGRIKWWRGKSPEIDVLVDRQLAHSWPAINTGVIGWRRGHPALLRWKELTLAGAGLHMTDELAMQLLIGEMRMSEFNIFDDRFNCSPIYGARKDDVRIWHFHGNKHLRKEPGRVLWKPLFRETLAANVGGLQEWAGRFDPQVRELLAGTALNTLPNPVGVDPTGV